MKYFSKLAHLIFISLAILSCKDDDDVSNSGNSNIPQGLQSSITCNRRINFEFDNTPSEINRSPINEFIFKGLNNYYLFREFQCELVTPNFSTQKGFENYAGQGGIPETFFEKLTIEQDRFSWIVDDFEELERSFSGETLETGMGFLAFLEREGSDDVYLVATRVSKGSPADREGIKRGDLFNRIDGQNLTRTNFTEIYNKNSFTLGKAQFQSDAVVDVSVEVKLTKVQLTEGTVPIEEVIEVDGVKIGYLFYTGFVRESELELNRAFQRLKNKDIDELVLDLRYNGGGSVSSALALCSMITGQFENEIIIKEQWNPRVQNIIIEDDPENLYSRFSATVGEDKRSISSLNLNKVYVLMTKRSTASASELVINSLRPYIDVITIGDGSVGKSQASITLYDSPAFFDKDNINPDHKYAIQPLVFRNINSNDEFVPNDGLIPTVFFEENVNNLGELGTLSDPFLKTAVDQITGNSATTAKNITTEFKIIGTSQDPNNPLYQQMYK